MAPPRRRRGKPDSSRSRAACAGRRATSCRARRGSSLSRSASTSIGTPFSASATRTRRWCGVSASAIASCTAREQLAAARPSRRAPARRGEARPTPPASSGTSRPCHARRRSFTAASSSANLYAQVVKRLRPRKSSRLREHRSAARRPPPPGDIVELVAAQVRTTPAPAGLEPRRPQQQRVEPGDGVVVRGPRARSARARRATPDRARVRGGGSRAAVVGIRLCHRLDVQASGGHVSHASSASSGRRMRAARPGGQPRSIRSISAWRSHRKSEARHAARAGRHHGEQLVEGTRRRSRSRRSRAQPGACPVWCRPRAISYVRGATAREVRAARRPTPIPSTPRSGGRRKEPASQRSRGARPAARFTCNRSPPERPSTTSATRATRRSRCCGSRSRSPRSCSASTSSSTSSSTGRRTSRPG